MARWHRPALIALALVALAASVAALYVHYHLIQNPDYSSFCDINATVSCQQVLESSYARVAGGHRRRSLAIWSGLVLLAMIGLLRDRLSPTAARVAGYIFVLATIGLAAVFYYAYTSFFVLRAACPLCLTIDASIIGIFLVSAAGAGSIAALPAALFADLGAVLKNRTSATMAVVWVVASLALLFTFPRDVAATAETPTAEASAPTETLTPEQINEWDTWLDAQPRVAEMQPTGDVKVLVVKFNDWECPACRALWLEYRGIVAKYEKQYPNVFKFEYKDFPLEAECGFGGAHQYACEAAAAVRMAREKGKGDQLGEYFYQHQDELSRDEIKQALKDIAGVTDFDQQYPKVIPAIREDATLGNKLGVNGTPTFFINGIKVPSLRPAYFDAAIAYSLRKAGVQS